VLVVLAAGQRDHRGQLAAAVVARLFIVPVEHVIQDRQRRSVAWTRPQHDLLAAGGLGIDEFDLLAVESVGVKPFVPRKHHVFDRVRRMDEAFQYECLGVCEVLVEHDVRSGAHRGNHASALGKPVAGEALESGKGDDLAHRMKLSWSCAEKLPSTGSVAGSTPGR